MGRDREKRDGNHDSDDDIVVIVKSCDGAVHPVTRCCNRTILTQSMSLLSKDSIKKNKRNLSKPRDLLSIISLNGKENVETLDQTFSSYFGGKLKHEEIDAGLGRSNRKNVVQVELHDVKFIHAMHARNWNRSYCPFLGCYCERGESFKAGHRGEIMTDAKYFIYHKNEVDEWEHELSVNPDCTREDHK